MTARDHRPRAHTVSTPGTQLTLDGRTPLHAVTFAVVDLETTGGSPAHSRITEVGVVRVRGGVVNGELATLVDPGTPIPAAITALTGIDASMVAGRPGIGGVLPALLEFLSGTVLVAHNARFDVGFLNAALTRSSRPVLEHPTLCTAALARRLIRDEVRNCKLATLATHVGARTRPEHRALADARATVDVLHALIERAGALGATTLEDLLALQRAGSAPVFAARRRLADDLPSAPGVYAFTSPTGAQLYVGAASDLRARVRQYFGSDARRRIPQLLRETARIEHWVTPTAVEAHAREARLIRRADPPYNRRGRARRTVWLKLTNERFPRLSIVRQRRPDGAGYLGPLSSQRRAQALADACYDLAPLRRCTGRIGRQPQATPCALADLRRCAGVCAGGVDAATYEAAITPVRALFAGDAGPACHALLTRMAGLAAAQRFEEAAAVRVRTAVLVETVRAARRADALAGTAVLLAAVPARAGWEVLLLRHGLLAGSMRVRDWAGQDAHVEALRASAGPCDPVAADSERTVLAGWLERPGARVLDASDGLAWPREGGAALSHLSALVRDAARTTGRPGDELAAKRRRRAYDADEASSCESTPA